MEKINLDTIVEVINELFKYEIGERKWQQLNKKYGIGIRYGWHNEPEIGLLKVPEGFNPKNPDADGDKDLEIIHTYDLFAYVKTLPDFGKKQWKLAKDILEDIEKEVE